MLFSICSVPTVLDVPTSKITNNDIQCLAANIYFESRGEPKRGQIAVAHVTINRKKNSAFPNTICKVVKQHKQFSWYNTKKRDMNEYTFPKQIRKLATDILLGKYKDPTNGSLYFHNTSVGPFDRKETVRIGDHIFYM